MTSELASLGVLVLVQMALGLWTQAMVGKVTGTKWLLSSRETARDHRQGIAGRLDRAQRNGYEALILFTPAVVLVVLSGQSTTLTAYAAWAFVVARLIYVGCYAADLVPWRTVAWLAGWVCVLAMVAGAFLAA
jgi:uncharacterized MAPEG superfamily protein